MAKDQEVRRSAKGKKCKACEYIDFKDVPMLRRFMSPHGKLYSRKRAQTCAKCQRLISAAIKRARFMGILSYTG